MLSFFGLALMDDQWTRVENIGLLYGAVFFQPSFSAM